MKTVRKRSVIKDLGPEIYDPTPHYFNMWDGSACASTPHQADTSNSLPHRHGRSKCLSSSQRDPLHSKELFKQSTANEISQELYPPSFFWSLETHIFNLTSFVINFRKEHELIHKKGQGKLLTLVFSENQKKPLFLHKLKKCEENTGSQRSCVRILSVSSLQLLQTSHAYLRFYF